MTARTVDFDDVEHSKRGVHRAELVLHGPGGACGSSVRFSNVLVDTGARHAQLPEDYAIGIGIDPTTGKQVTISTASGPATRWYRLVDLEMQGVRCRAGVYFAPPGSMPLIGRSTMSAAFETIGVTASDWLREDL